MVWNQPDVLEMEFAKMMKQKVTVFKSFLPSKLNQINWETLTCLKVNKHLTLANFSYMLTKQTWVHAQ